MSVYEFISPLGGGGAAQAIQKETHLYGSSRLGILNRLTLAPTTTLLTADFGNASFSTFTRGEKIFELSNHLGNVLVTVSDKKLAVADPNNANLIAYYNADVVTASDYYPFGMQMSGRKYSQPNSSYRYGFNGKENDNSTGEGNLDFGARIMDVRLGRWLSVDPLASKMPAWSPYASMFDNPLRFIDPNGMKPDDIIFTSNGKEVNRIKSKIVKTIEIGNETLLSAHIRKDGRVSYVTTPSTDATTSNDDSPSATPANTKAPESVAPNEVAKTNDVVGVGADVVQLGAGGGASAMTSVAKGSTDLAVKGSAVSSGKALRSFSKVAGRLGVVSGGLDVGVAAVDLVNTLVSNASTGDKVAAGTKLAIKAAIFAIGFSNPITGAILGVADAFGATDALTEWIGNKIDGK